MPTLFESLQEKTREAVLVLYQHEVPISDIQLQLTRKEFEGELTVVVFPFVQVARNKPEVVGEAIGLYLKDHFEPVTDFNVIKGFLNLRLADAYWAKLLLSIADDLHFTAAAPTGQSIVLEYCGPNTNKPLHLGHIRNMVIGYSMAEILAAAGHEVHKVNIYNDRGIAICKSMLAWQLFGHGETPQSSGIKGDHLIGKYYVRFAQEHAKEVEELVAQGLDKEKAKQAAPLQQQAQEMLRQWENGDEAVLALWRTMNDWVYAGFEQTYQKLGVDFEKAYYESETYTDGRNMVLDGLEKGYFKQHADGSIWVDLTDMGMDEKILLRSDGTSVYLTQDLGTAQARFNDYQMDRSIYVVANEQEYHFNALKATLQKLGKPFADGIYHLSYGMVDLPTGKMKSREGTTVDADDLYDEMIQTAATTTQELGKSDGLNETEAQALYSMIGMGALKYFLLRVNPKKRILFDPQESIDFQGDTGPFIQYTHARIRSVHRKWTAAGKPTGEFDGPLSALERQLVLHLYRYPQVVQEAAADYDPSHIANYIFTLAKTYNRFYADHPILQGDDDGQKYFRVQLSQLTATIIQKGMRLLGIDVPEQM